MSNKLNVMSLMADLDAVDANCITVGGVARVTSVEVVHWKWCVGRDFVQALTAAHRLLDLIVIVENFIRTANYWLNAAREAQTAKFIVENLIILESGRCIVRDFHSGCQSVENSIPSQYGMRLRWDKNAGLSIAENVVFLQHAFATVEDANAAIASIVDLVALQRRVRVGLDPNARHGIIENLILLEHTQSTVVNEHTAILAAPDLISPDNWITSGADLDARVQVIEDVIVLELAVPVIVEVNADLLSRVNAIPTQHRRAACRDPDAG